MPTRPTRAKWHLIQILDTGLPAWIPGVWAIFLIVGSLQPHRLRSISQGHDLHPVFHFFSFGTLAALVLLTNSRWPRTLRFLGCLALGFLIEIAQSFAFPDAIEWWDVRDDTLGVIFFSGMTVAFLYWLGRRFKTDAPNSFG